MRRYRLSEVEAIVGEERHTIVYWEQETGLLQERKDDSGRRYYTESDLAILFRIRHLVRESHYTIQGAKEVLLRELADDAIIQLKASADMVRAPLIEALSLITKR